MRLVKISLENIRSYESQEIEFSEGSTLLSGDIGSGKTSILLAIEFALFGLQPGQRGSSLLRNGADQGKVRIEFEIEDKLVTIERKLKRGKKTISQEYCSIDINGVKKESSVTELKSTVLDLLNYPKEFSKKQNILYKFTVYTPQEQMKEIILHDPETRINTLRHVFGIDKYKTILENTSVLLSKIREQKRLKQGMTMNLEQEKENLANKEQELESKRYNLVSVEKELFSKQEARKKAQEEKDEIAKKIEEKNSLQSEVEKAKLGITAKKDLILSNEKSIQSIQTQIQESQALTATFDESQISQIEKQVEILKQEKQELSEKNLDLTSQMRSLSMKNQENQELKDKITSLKMCPTCLQDVDPVHKSNVSNKMETDIVSNVKQIEQLTLEKRKITEQLNKIDFQISDSQNKVQELKILKVKIQTLEEKKSRIQELKKANETLEKDMDLLNNHITQLKSSIFELNKYNNIFQQKTEAFDLALNQERQAEIKVAELRKEIQVFTAQIDELKDRIQRTEEIKKQLIYISELEIWVNNNFIPLISSIEQNVMIKLKSEFSQLFSEWFAMLVSDSFVVRLDDSFTPIIEHQDYELDYSYLSGGERTAVALAYRLALNQVINSLLSKIKTRDLVILDEPTDGFSSQQLDKMREVFEELNVSQLIIVSHEQKMEGFVENVIRLKKEHGLSGAV